MSQAPDASNDYARVAKVHQNISRIQLMSRIERLAEVQNIRAKGGDWELAVENIRKIVDPMDVLTDAQIFGVEIPWREKQEE